jgi:hypothetical protein
MTQVEHADGAVRSTPRTSEAPELFWSPTSGLYRQTRYAGLNRILTTEHRQVIGGVPHDALPSDTVRLVLDDPATRRPVVLLRADDCDCAPPYADCPHGPEPVDALDLAVWLHAEQTWRVDGVVEQVNALGDERDALQARLDAAVTKLDAYDGAGLMFHDELRATLLCSCKPDRCLGEGDPPNWCEHCATIDGELPCPVADAQSTEQESHCMNGPAKQHTLRMVEIIKALKAASADGVLPGEFDDRASFARLARAIVDHWPTGEADRG